MPIKTLIDHKLRVSLDALPEGALDMLMDALSIPNLARVQAKKMDEWGWQQMPETISLYKIVNEGDELAQYVHLEMPRGFLGDFAAGMASLGETVELVEGRKWQKIFPLKLSEINLFPWQEEQIETLLAWEQGIIKSPAGSGKTAMILRAIGRLSCKAIVIVNTKDILWQWMDRAEKFLGPDYPVGQIGDDKFEPSQYLTIATAQTLHSRFDEIEAGGFFDSFSFMCLDECHHATAGTYNKIVNRFSSRYRVGVSATPDKTGDFALAQMVLGTVIHETKPAKVTNLIKPRVVRVPTKFGFGFRGHKNRWQRSNYPKMIEALISDPERNKLIVDKIMENQGHRQLVVTKRLEHIEVLQTMLEDRGCKDHIVTLIGKDSNDHRKQVAAWAEDRPIIILSTLADEALDIPILDRMHLVFPQRNAGLIVQQVGRVERKHPNKRDAIIFDYTDGNVGALNAQWKVRRFEVYEPRGYKIETWRFG
jgi:superfamily II DNA or RNA helicase